MRRLLAYLRWARDAGWRDALGDRLYWVRTWRCRVSGHLWGDEQRAYEYAGYPVHVETWRECLRPNCREHDLLWSIYWPPGHENCRCTFLDSGVLL